MQQVKLLMTVFGLALVRSEVNFGDPCYLVPRPQTFGNDQIDLAIPQNCTYGTVDWNYPMGTIYMHLTRQGEQYSLCLETAWGTMLGGLKELTDGIEQAIALPTDDAPACTQDVDGKTEFLISAVSELLYMTNFNYRVVLPAST